MAGIRKTKKGIDVDFGSPGTRYLIGSRMYPVADPKHTYTFDGAVCNKHFPQLDRLLPLLESKRHLFRSGYCYDAADHFQQLAASVGVEVMYFAGWLFTGDRFPMHHAWCVAQDKKAVEYEGQLYDQPYLFDLTTDVPLFSWMVANESRILLTQNWRTEAAKVHLENERRPLAEIRILGPIPAEPIPFLYVGSPDTITGARNRVMQLSRNFPNHPSSAYKKPHGLTTLDPSPFQLEVKRLRAGLPPNG